MSAEWTAFIPRATYEDEAARAEVEAMALQALHDIATFPEGGETRTVDESGDLCVVTFTAP